MFAVVDIFYIAASAGAAGWLVWNYKDKLQSYWQGAEKFAATAKAKADAAQTTLDKIKAAVKK